MHTYIHTVPNGVLYLILKGAISEMTRSDSIYHFCLMFENFFGFCSLSYQQEMDSANKYKYAIPLYLGYSCKCDIQIVHPVHAFYGFLISVCIICSNRISPCNGQQMSCKDCTLASSQKSSTTG